MVKTHGIALGGQTLERRKPKRGTAGGAYLIVAPHGTDSQGEQSREVGKRHSPHS